MFLIECECQPVVGGFMSRSLQPRFMNLMSDINDLGLCTLEYLSMMMFSVGCLRGIRHSRGCFSGPNPLRLVLNGDK